MQQRRRLLRSNCSYLHPQPLHAIPSHPLPIHHHPNHPSLPDRSPETHRPPLITPSNPASLSIPRPTWHCPDLGYLSFVAHRWSSRITEYLLFCHTLINVRQRSESTRLISPNFLFPSFLQKREEWIHVSCYIYCVTAFLEIGDWWILDGWYVRLRCLYCVCMYVRIHQGGEIGMSQAGLIYPTGGDCAHLFLNSLNWTR